MSLMSQIALTVTPYRLEIDHKESPETTLYWNGNSIGVSFLSAAFAVSAIPEGTRIEDSFAGCVIPLVKEGFNDFKVTESILISVANWEIE